MNNPPPTGLPTRAASPVRLTRGRGGLRFDVSLDPEPVDPVRGSPRERTIELGYLGLTPRLAGLYQANVYVPDDLPPGTYAVCLRETEFLPPGVSFTDCQRFTPSWRWSVYTLLPVGR